MGSSLVWGDVRSFAVTEYDRSCDLGIFLSWRLKFMSPYRGTYKVFEGRDMSGVTRQRYSVRVGEGG